MWKLTSLFNSIIRLIPPKQICNHYQKYRWHQISSSKCCKGSDIFSTSSRLLSKPRNSNAACKTIKLMADRLSSAAECFSSTLVRGDIYTHCRTWFLSPLRLLSIVGGFCSKEAQDHTASQRHTRIQRRRSPTSSTLAIFYPHRFSRPPSFAAIWPTW